MRRSTLALVVGVTVVAVSLGAAAHANSHSVSGAEVAAARWVYDLPTWLTTALEVVMQVGTRGAIIVAALGVWIVAGRRAAIAVAGAGAGAWVFAAVLKALDVRDRPTASALGRDLRAHVEGAGYPSSHAAIAAGLAVVLVAVVLSVRPGRRWVGIVGVGLAAATAVARVHLGVHWPLDVLGGAALGLISGTIAVRCCGLSTV